MKELKISFCTTCMGRLHHLQKTLPKNVEDNVDYNNIEFVILNYNSKDSLDTWIKNNFSDYIDRGKLVYAKVNGPNYFHLSHAKNLVAKCSSGDVICNVDADNFIRKDFAKYINDKFLTHRNVFLNTDINRSPKDVCGRIAIRREDFFDVGGYDENMKGWGYEDEDLKKRLLAKGINYMPIDNAYLQFLPHKDSERTLNEENFLNIDQVWMNELNNEEIDIIYIFKDSTYKFGALVKYYTEEHYVLWILKNNVWIEGQCLLENNSNQIILIDEDNNVFKRIACGSSKEHLNANRNDTFYRITDSNDLEIAKHHYSKLNNFSIMREKLSNKIINNTFITGKEAVFFDFSNSATMI